MLRMKQKTEYKYPIQTSSWVYSFLYPWIAKGVDFFLHDLHVVGGKNIPPKGPLMLVANHQNAMFDPLICCRVFPRQLHWLTRSDVFKNKWIASFLQQIHMLPIYREKDNVENQMGKNEEVFKVCRERLSKGAVVAMFPEGSHRGKKQLMVPLKKGFARLAFSSVEKDQRLLNLKILPVGLDYSHFFEYQPRILVVIGEPISIADFWPLYQEDANKAINQLVKETNERLSSVMVDIKSDEGYDMLIDLEPLFWDDQNNFGHAEFLKYQKWVSDWPHCSEEEKQLFYRYHQMLNQMEISAAQVEHYLLSSWPVFISYWVEWIPAKIGQLLFFPLYGLTEYFIKKKIQDELFYNSIRLAFYTFLAPIYLLVLYTVFALLFPALPFFDKLMGGLFFVSTGLFLIAWHKTKRKVIGYRMGKSLSNHERWNELIEVRNQIKKHG